MLNILYTIWYVFFQYDTYSILLIQVYIIFSYKYLFNIGYYVEYNVYSSFVNRIFSNSV